eukprot:8040962-Heterocapsa_arctica.AAC.1
MPGKEAVMGSRRALYISAIFPGAGKLCRRTVPAPAVQLRTASPILLSSASLSNMIPVTSTRSFSVIQPAVVMSVRYLSMPKALALSLPLGILNPLVAALS